MNDWQPPTIDQIREAYQFRSDGDAGNVAVLLAEIDRLTEREAAAYERGRQEGLLAVILRAAGMMGRRDTSNPGTDTMYVAPGTFTEREPDEPGAGKE